jgi:hypothetical protein
MALLACQGDKKSGEQKVLTQARTCLLVCQHRKHVVVGAKSRVHSLTYCECCRPR